MQSLTDKSATEIAVEEGNVLVLRGTLAGSSADQADLDLPMTFTAVPAGRMEMKLQVTYVDPTDGATSMESVNIPYWADDGAKSIRIAFAEDVRWAYATMVRALRDRAAERWRATS